MNSSHNGFVPTKQEDGAPHPDSLDSVTGEEHIPFSERLRKYRLFRKLSISELARRAGLAKSYVSMLESGKRMPGAKAAWRLAFALEVPGDDMLLFVLYGHEAKQTQAGRGISRQEYMQTIALSAVTGGPCIFESRFWGPNRGKRSLQSFTKRGFILRGPPFTRVR